MSSIVYVPALIRTRVNNDTWVDKYDLSKAEKFGKIQCLLQPNVNSNNLHKHLDRLKHGLKDFQLEDYLLCIGSPVLIAASAHIAMHHTCGLIQFLQWSNKERDYHSVQFTCSM